jgi:hypothetical protein
MICIPHYQNDELVTACDTRDGRQTLTALKFEKPEERDHSEDHGADGRIPLKWILK